MFWRRGLRGLSGPGDYFIDTQGQCRPISELKAYTRAYLDEYYVMFPTQFMTVQQQLDYFSDTVARWAKDEDTSQVNFGTPTGSSSVDTLVRDSSPQSYMRRDVRFVQTRLPGACGPSTPSAPAPQPNRTGCPQNMRAACVPPGVFDEYTCNCVRPVTSGPSGPSGPSRTTPPASGTYTPPPSRPGYWTDADGHTRPDSELESYAWSYLNNFYDLRPMGGETVQQLKERIMYVFLRHQGVTSSGATFDSAIGPVLMDDVVRDVSPMSSPKPKSVASTNTQIAVRQQGVIPALTRPAAGKVPVKADWTQLFALVNSAMVGYADSQKQQAAAQLMAIQNSGRPLYVDDKTARNMAKKSDNTLLYVGLGVVALGGLFLLLQD